MTKNDLKAITDKGAIVKFTKKDGSERLMKCSTDWKNIALLDPNFVAPKGNEKEDVKDETITPNEDPNSLMVWDIESRGFRKIIVNSVLEVKPV